MSGDAASHLRRYGPSIIDTKNMGPVILCILTAFQTPTLSFIERNMGFKTLVSYFGSSHSHVMKTMPPVQMCSTECTHSLSCDSWLSTISQCDFEWSVSMKADSIKQAELIFMCSGDFSACLVNGIFTLAKV